MSLKFQAQILKNPGMWKWDSDEEYIYFTDGAMARRIPAGDCLLNPEQFRQRKGVSDLFRDEKPWEEMDASKLRIKDSGYTAVQLVSDSGQVCWINEMYYKPFSKFIWEYSGKDFVRVRNPGTLELEAVVAIMKIRDK